MKTKRKMVKKLKKAICEDNIQVNNTTLDQFNKGKYISIIILSMFLLILLTISILPGSIVNDSFISKYGNLIHFFGYLILCPIFFAVFLNFEVSLPVTYTLFIGSFVAILTEVLQLFIPGRHGTFPDICINLAGFFIIPILVFIITEIYASSEENYESY